MRLSQLWALLLVAIIAVPAAHAYSVLSHEAIIDRNWDAGIKPLLLKRYPDATDEQLREAHAHAYGGAIIQDMGYYPFGNKFFSDLLHYTRSGDFILFLIHDAKDLNEYAFALGALAHYAADNSGHPIAVNRAVPMVYPKLRDRYGPVVTYEEAPAEHLKTEFGFDTIEVARGKYASEAYHDFIGFKVAKPLLERAFEDTYSLPLKGTFRDLDLALGTFRFSVSQVIPEMTKAAWTAKKKDIQQLQAGMTKRKFVYRYSHADFHKEGYQHLEPGPGARFLACLFKIVPKVGPFKAFSFKVPPLEAEKLFIASFNETMTRYRELLREVGDDHLQLRNENFDTGRPTSLGDYQMADNTYSKLLEKFEGAPEKISPELKANVLAFYGNSDGPVSPKARAVLAALRSTKSSD
ncbi:MAG TPA: zinc dependent phospholipase C family protein [Bryobacteraceae bacterium]|nr:zinc dependent phospholipase C family protein [Bryobacteraceae bacterium]